MVARARVNVLAATLLAGLAASDALAQSATTEDRLRNQLRQTTLELRAAQDENAALKAKQQELEQAAATDRNKPAQPAPPPPDTREIERLRNMLASEKANGAALQQQLDQFQQQQAQWEKAYQQAADLARSRDAEARKYQAQFQDSDGRLQTCTRDNEQLFTLGNELLQRYRDKGVWDSLKDSEPFTKIHQIELEKLAQNYHAKLLDQHFDPAATVDKPVAHPGN